ncbi:MAG TPA: DbpA RNA binding domain-containing protein, partial [Herpetosiphonaceae bacterium]
GEQYSPVELAAAAFKLLLAEPDMNEADPLSAPEPELEYDRRDGRDRRDRNRGREERAPRNRSFTEAGMTRLFVDVGREQGVRPADIVGAIANESGLPGRSIGAIDIFDSFTFVDVPDDAANRVLQALSKTQIRGQKISPTLARPRGK